MPKGRSFIEMIPPLLREALEEADHDLLQHLAAIMYYDHPEKRRFIESLFFVDKSEVPKFEGDDTEPEDEAKLPVEHHETNAPQPTPAGEEPAKEAKETKEAKEAKEPATTEASKPVANASTIAANVARLPVPDLKRKRHRYATCYNCEAEYDVRNNHEEACFYHDGAFTATGEKAKNDLSMSGDLEYDQTYWGRYCERPGNSHIATQENFEEQPEGFNWTCCDESGESEGCQTGPHIDNREEVTEKKRVCLIQCCGLEEVEI
ncbi:hypothetical protein HDK64DRAFT_313433 [Phyllosticta capitalensis]|uniref:Uncharacterized protein n=1 Tax=Phyllosticta capitalensis TaxID=121624 RepID=A0ABR1YUN4_9PEZI